MVATRRSLVCVCALSFLLFWLKCCFGHLVVKDIALATVVRELLMGTLGVLRGHCCRGRHQGEVNLVIYSKVQEQGDGLLEEVVVVALIWLGGHSVEHMDISCIYQRAHNAGVGYKANVEGWWIHQRVGDGGVWVNKSNAGRYRL